MPGENSFARVPRRLALSQHPKHFKHFQCNKLPFQRFKFFRYLVNQICQITLKYMYKLSPCVFFKDKYLYNYCLPVITKVKYWNSENSQIWQIFNTRLKRKSSNDVCTVTQRAHKLRCPTWVSRRKIQVDSS